MNFKSAKVWSLETEPKNFVSLILIGILWTEHGGLFLSNPINVIIWGKNKGPCYLMAGEWPVVFTEPIVYLFASVCCRINSGLGGFFFPLLAK